MSKILVIHGPNLNMLGSREPSQYGHANLDDISAKLTKLAKQAGHELENFQSNAEHALIERIHLAKGDGVTIIIINPAAFTHTSVALRDALLAVDIPFIEVHISNVYKREEFRQHSYFSDIAIGVITGLGAQGYEYALMAAVSYLSDTNAP